MRASQVNGLIGIIYRDSVGSLSGFYRNVRFRDEG